MKFEEKLDSEEVKIVVEDHKVPNDGVLSDGIDARRDESPPHPVPGVSNEQPPGEAFPDLGPNFEILQLIGSGGMSVVYKARSKQTGSIVAIKVINALLAKDKATLKRFEKESQALVELNDSELLNIYGSGVTRDGAPYLVMEFIEGKSLAEILA